MSLLALFSLPLNLSANSTQSALDWFGQHLDANNPWMVAVVGGAISAILAWVILYFLIERRKEKRAKGSLMKQIEDLGSSSNSSDLKKIEETIAKYEELLKSTSEPDARGHIKLNLANCRYNLAILGHDKENDLKEAIQAYKDALNTFTIKKDPANYAGTQNNLGNAYQTLAEVRDKEENINSAIRAYEEALKIYTVDRYPVGYAGTQNNLGNIYKNLAEVRDKEENTKSAIEAYEEALKIRTVERYPVDYAMTQNNLGLAYKNLSEVRDKEENLKSAIEAYEEALKIITVELYPIDYATTQNNLGNAYRILAEVRDKEENLKKAIEAYEEALKIYTAEEYPLPHETVISNLEKSRLMASS